MKKRIGIFLIVILTIVCQVPVTFGETRSTEIPINIVHTNDMHGYYTSNSYTGSIGFEKLKTFIDTKNPDLVLDVGDTYHGQSFATLEKGESIAKLMKAVGYDAMTVGNHDWSYGAERLHTLETSQDFPILAANVESKSGKSYFNTPYLTKEITTENGEKILIGIIGVIDDSFYTSTASKNVADVDFQEETTIANDLAKTLRDKEKCDIVIAMTHQLDCESFVKKIKGIDAVLTGHEHVLLNRNYKDADGKEVPTVQAGYYFKNIGLLTLNYDTANKKITGYTETAYSEDDMDGVAADPTITELRKGIEAGQTVLLNEVIGKSSGDYPYSWEKLRISQQPIGAIVANSYINTSGADIAIENAGGIRAGINKGNITYGDLINISPYGNTIVTKKLTGKEIIDVVERSIEISRVCNEVNDLQENATAEGKDPYQYSWPDNSGSALQFGGISVKYNMSKPLGKRVVYAEVHGTAIDENKEYTVATNNYVAESEGYPALASAPLLKEYGTCEEAIRIFIENGDFEDSVNSCEFVVVTDDPEDNPDNDNPGNDNPDIDNPDSDNPDIDNSDNDKPEDDNDLIEDNKPENQEPKDDYGNAPETGDNGMILWIIAFIVSASSLYTVKLKKK